MVRNWGYLLRVSFRSGCRSTTWNILMILNIRWHRYHQVTSIHMCYIHIRIDSRSCSFIRSTTHQIHGDQYLRSRSVKRDRGRESCESRTAWPWTEMDSYSSQTTATDVCKCSLRRASSLGGHRPTSAGQVVWRWPMTGESSSATTRRTELGWFTSSSSDHCPRTSNPSIYTSPYSFIAAAENFDALLQFSRPCRCCVFQFSDYSNGIALWFSKYECLIAENSYTQWCIVS